MTALNRNPSNINLLQSTKFRVTFERLRGLTYFCQSANFPGISLTEIVRPTPFIDLYHPGEKLIYDTFNVTFLINEDLETVVARSNLTRQPPVYSDASLTFFTNKNNPSFRIKFADVFPTSLSTITFSTGDTAENIMTADATFRFSYYNYERI